MRTAENRVEAEADCREDVVIRNTRGHAAYFKDSDYPRHSGGILEASVPWNVFRILLVFLIRPSRPRLVVFVHSLIRIIFSIKGNETHKLDGSPR